MKKNNLMKNTKNTMALGIGSMAGMGIMGSMSGLPGMPSQAKGVSNIASTGLLLGNVGQLGKTGIGIAKDLGKNKKKVNNQDIVSKILYR